MATRRTTFRGLPPSVLEGFLAALGGRRKGEWWEGDGWRATYKGRKVQAFVYLFDEIDFTLEGEQGVVDRILKELRARAWGSGKPKG